MLIFSYSNNPGSSVICDLVIAFIAENISYLWSHKEDLSSKSSSDPDPLFHFGTHCANHYLCQLHFSSWTRTRIQKGITNSWKLGPWHWQWCGERSWRDAGRSRNWSWYWCSQGFTLQENPQIQVKKIEKEFESNFEKKKKKIWK